jgi:hypothetical protein
VPWRLNVLYKQVAEGSRTSTQSAPSSPSVCPGDILQAALAGRTSEGRLNLRKLSPINVDVDVEILSFVSFVSLIIHRLAERGSFMASASLPGGVGDGIMWIDSSGSVKGTMCHQPVLCQRSNLSD